MKTPLLAIKGLKVSVEDTLILKGIDLEIFPGETHAIMGPNGSGKSTLAAVLAGRPEYNVVEGEVYFQGKPLLEMEPEERARQGLFLAFQYPVEIPGVSNINFLKTAVNEVRKARGMEPYDAYQFLTLVKAKVKELEFPEEMLRRSLNEGFSGGEKKRNEMLQMTLLEPILAILDETDSGLDIDAIKIVARTVNRMRTPERSFLIITHYQRLLNYIEPDRVHVLYDGRIVKSGGKELALQLEAEGYDWLKQQNVIS